MSLLAVDTNVLIGMIREGGSAEQSEFQRKCRIILEIAEEDHCKILLPTIVVAEFLSGISQSSQNEMLVELNSQFTCASFSLEAAKKAAEVWQIHNKLSEKDRMARKVLKADVLIIATAITQGASRFYSADKKCKNLALKAGLQATDVPSHIENLFKDSNPGK